MPRQRHDPPTTLRPRPVRRRLAATLLAFLTAGASSGAVSSAAHADEPTTKVVATVRSGDGPYQLGAIPALGRVYAAESQSAAVGVYDTATKKKVDDIETPDKTPLGLAVDRRSKTVYTSTLEDTLEVLDARTGKLVRSVAIGGHVHSVAVDEKKHFAIVAKAGSAAVTYVNQDGYAWSVNVGDTPTGVAVHPVTGDVYVANAGDDTLSVIDGETQKVTKTIDVGTWPSEIGVDAATGRVYVANWKSHDVSVVDPAAGEVVSTVAVGKAPVGVRVNEATHAVYVTDTEDATVSVIDGTTGKLREQVAVGNFPLGLAVVNAKTVWVSNRQDNTLSVVKDLA